MPKILKITRLGNPLLRKIPKRLTKAEIKSEKIQTLIADISYTLKERRYGVGMAATQVGQSVALSVIGIKPTPNRPELKPFNSVIINPEIVQTYGEKVAMWEGCVSCGSGDDILFGLTKRYKKVKLKWLDENAVERVEVISGFPAHVAQHEIDHLNGILFVDNVEDPKSYMMADEYRKRIIKPRIKKAKQAATSTA